MREKDEFSICLEKARPGENTVRRAIQTAFFPLFFEFLYFFFA